MRTYFLLIFAFIPFSLAICQSKKEVKSLKITSVTETTTELVNGKELTYKSNYESFDKKGNNTEKTEFNPDGSVKKKNTTKFDAKGNKTEETDYSEKDTKPNKSDVKNTRITYKYNANDDKLEELHYNATTNELVKKISYSYNSLGNKTMEIVFDASNKLIKKSVFSYDKKNLKVEKKTYNSENQLIETKKYTYTYY